MAISFADRLDREHAAAGSAGTAGRKAARETLAALGLPSTREDNWKYANLRALERMRLVPVVARAATAVPALPQRIGGFCRQVFVDGIHAPALSDSPGADGSGQLTFRTLGEETIDTPLRIPSTHAGDLRFALLNTAFAVDGARLVVPRSERTACVELIFLATAEGTAAASYPRIEVVLEPGARLQLIEQHLSDGDSANFVNTAAEILIGETAQLSHFRIQHTSSRALWLDTLNAEVARDARYALYTIALGASSARSTCFLRLAGEGSQACVLAAAVADRHQVLDSYVRVEHAAPRTTTDEIFRGIAAGRSRVGFNGAVVVQANARGADSKQSLRGLLAGPESEIDARPQLEIYTDEVSCSHGATAGTLDENMLFYLLSRGIDRETAKSLLEWAFLEDVIARIDIPELRKQVEHAVAGRLRNVTNLQELP